ncbi:MAG: hypothetical protein LBI15_04530 [Dysgonamonadaceae bacterium]|jgi:hypothetical protein|nr:hypothetical protein [Dysgonamonadaceae bacterium]
MKKYYSIFIVAMLILSAAFTSCGSETEIIEEPQIPELDFNTDNITVKVGEENKFTLQITSGGGEFNAFALNNELATATVVGNTVVIEGLANGITSVVVSDKNGLFARIPVTVYTTNVMQLEDTQLTLVARTGWLSRPVDNPTTTILLSNGGLEDMPNGGFTIVSDHENVTATIANVTVDDVTVPVITISGTSSVEPFIANVTITDVSGISAVLQVNVEPTMVPYNEAEMAMTAFLSTTRRYQLSAGGNGTAAAALWGTNINGGFTNWSINGVENGQLLFGYDSAFGTPPFFFRALWPGDTSIGVKTNGSIAHNRGGNAPSLNIMEPVPARIEVVRNDGVRIWVVYSFVHDGLLRWGYFVDTI